MTTSSYRAFTLVEIVVILAIIGILAAITFPAVSRARASARTSTCATNLRQIGQALASYTSDNDGFYPPCYVVDGPKSVSSLWWMHLNLSPAPYCPDVNREWRKDDPELKDWVNGYALNKRLNRKLGSRAEPKLLGKPEFIMSYPPLTVTVFDARPVIFGVGETDMSRTAAELKWSTRPKDFDSYILSLPPGAQRHQGGANYLFGDGHVKWFRPEQLSISRLNDGVHPGFGL